MTGTPMMVHCAECEHEWAACQLPAAIEVVAQVATRPCPSCGSRRVMMGPVARPTADGDAIGWLTNGDTGTSSITIWHVLMGRPKPRRFYPDVPYDFDDFGRCYRLLQIMPSWRARLGEVAAVYPAWRPLVEHWDELERLYLEDLPLGWSERCYALMRRLRGEKA